MTAVTAGTRHFATPSSVVSILERETDESCPCPVLHETWSRRTISPPTRSREKKE